MLETGTSPLPEHLPDANDVLGWATRWAGDGAGVALATVIETGTSAPRPVGSQMAVRADGTMVGSVSTGCIEEAVVREALKCLRDMEPRLLEFGGQGREKDVPGNIRENSRENIGEREDTPANPPRAGRLKVYVEPLVGCSGTAPAKAVFSTD